MIPYASGKCTNGKDCPYKHEKADNAASAPGHGEPTDGAKGKGKGKKCSFFAKGMCKSGDQCLYAHSRSPSPKAKVNPKPKPAAAAIDLATPVAAAVLKSCLKASGAGNNAGGGSPNGRDPACPAVPTLMESFELRTLPKVRNMLGLLKEDHKEALEIELVP
jgi:hypothetical protein